MLYHLMEIISYFKKELNYAKKQIIRCRRNPPSSRYLLSGFIISRKMVYFWCTNGVLTALFCLLPYHLFLRKNAQK